MKQLYKSAITGLLTLFLFFSQQSSAQWTSNTATNTAVSTIEQNHANMHQTVSDGAGGTFVVWRDNRNSVTSDYDIYAQYFNASGVAQWTANGIAVCTATGLQTYPYVITDGSGGIVVGWMDKRNGTDFDIYAQKVNAAGAVQWTANGVAISTATRGQGSLYGYGGEHGFDITTDGSGGAILAWMDLRDNADNHHCSVYAQRVNSAGTVQWTANGVAIYVATGYTNYPPNYVEILTDGANGAFIVWADNRSGDTENQNLYAQRVNASGVAQWTANGVTVSDASNNQYGYGKSIVSDGANGLIVTWSDIRSGIWQIYAQRFNSSGVAQWTASGVAITNYTSNTNPRQYNRAISDGANGAIISWDDYRNNSWDIYAQRINASGAVQWTANGVVISNATNDQTFNQMITDGNNGAIITWQDARSGTHIYAQRINNAGTVQWTANGVAVATATAQAGQQNPMISVANSGGAVVVFEDDRQNIYYRSLWIQKINADGTATVLSSNADLSALTISSGTLSPSFGSSITTYTASVVNGISSITVTPTRSDANATIQAQVNSGGYSTVTSGSPSSSLSLNVGSNTINVKVTAQDGSTIKTYTITVTRAALPVPPTITSFTPASGTVGTSVTITGTNFNTTAANNIVYFGATKATVAGTPTATSITVTVPAGATFAPITLINTGFNLSVKSRMRFNPTFTGGKTTIASSDFDAAVTTALSDPAFSYQVTTGDLDGDGKPEVVAAGRNSSSVIVLKNTSTSGTVSFGTRYDFASAYQEQFAVELADMDGDGKLDIVANGGNLNGFGISVLRNTSSGTGNFSFATATGVVTNSTGLTITTGDVDADGKPDIIAADGDKIVVYRNTSSIGSLSFTNTYNTGSGTQSNYVSCRPTVADIDGDGKLDIVSSNDANVQVFLNTSSGTGNINFGTASTFAAAYSVMRTAVADFDGDGKLDIATSGNYGSATTVLGIFRNTSTGATPTFTRSDYTTTDPGDISIADFNGDGKADIAISNLTLHGSYQPVSVYQNKSTSGTISFSSKIDVGVSGAFSPYYSTSSDLDGDGKPDIITSNGPSIAVFHNNSSVPVWTGATSSAWNTASNWSPAAVPASGAEVSIPSGTPNVPEISSTTTIGDLNIAAGATFTTTGNLQVTGTLTNNGSITGTGSVVLNGSSAQIINGTGSITNLTINNAAGVSITSGAGNSVKITGTLTPTAGMLTTNGNLTLGSTAAGTAMIAAGTGTYISGNVTLERYIPSNNRKKYTLISSPVAGTTIYNAWQEAGASTAGYGTQITGPTGTSAADGFDATSASGLASIFTYNDNNATNTKWVGVTNTNVNTVGGGKGYLLFVRGDRTITPASVSGNNTTLRATGPLTTGTVTLNVASGLTTGANKYSLVANPYAAPIDWLSGGITKTQLVNSFTVYDPNLQVFVTSTGSILSPSVASQQQPRYIQSGQAFFIQNDATGSAPSLAMTEAAKAVTTTGTSTTVFGNEALASRLNLNIYSSADNVFADGVVAVFGSNYKAGLDKEDAGKMNNFTETFALARNGKALSIEGRPVVSGNDTLFFTMNNFSKKAYTLKIDGSNFTATNAALVDNYTGSATALDLAATTIYDFTINSDAASSAADRFMVVFGSTAKNVATDVAADNNKLFVKLSPNPVANKLQVSFATATTENTVISIINSLGQVVRKVNAGKVNAGTTIINVSTLAQGNYMVQLVSGDKKVAIQKLVKE